MYETVGLSVNPKKLFKSKITHKNMFLLLVQKKNSPLLIMDKKVNGFLCKIIIAYMETFLNKEIHS